MKKTVTLILILTLCVAMLAACGGKTGGGGDATSPGSESASGAGGDPTFELSGSEVTINVMLMPSGDMNDATVKKVTDAVNARIAELGYKFKVKFSWSGPAWGFDALDVALQTGAADADIIPAHSWSGTVTYVTGAASGQYLRLDNPSKNYLEKFGPALYGKASSTIKAAANVNGKDGFGVYGYIIEKDSVTDVGYLVNTTVLEELGFKLSDFSVDIAKWGDILAAFHAKYPGKYPLNIEPAILDRAYNQIAYADDGNGPLAIAFDNNNIAGANVSISSRYESDSYKNFIKIMRGYYENGYVDPDQGSADPEISSGSFAARRDGGDYLISTCVYAPGFENVMSAAATSALGAATKIDWVSAYKSPIGFTETAMGSGLAVYAGTKHAPEAVTFLNLLASDTVIGNLLSEGVEGESYKLENGIAWRIGDRAGWSMWRYGVVGTNSGATPLGDVDANGQEGVLMKAFNNAAAALPSTGWVFDKSPVEDKYTATIATCRKYAIPLGSGAMNPAEFDTFIKELKAVGVDDVIAEANRQYDAFKAAQ